MDLVLASIGRYKRVIGDALRSRTGQTEATEVAIAAAALNRMLAFGRPNYVRITQITDGTGVLAPAHFQDPPPCNTVPVPPPRNEMMWRATISRMAQPVIPWLSSGTRLIVAP